MNMNKNINYDNYSSNSKLKERTKNKARIKF